jgi:hypothetical protein
MVKNGISHHFPFRGGKFYIDQRTKIGKKDEATTQYFIYSGDKAYTVKKG